MPDYLGPNSQEHSEKDFAVIVEVEGTMVVVVSAVTAQAACRKVDAMIENGSALEEAEDLELSRVVCTSYAEES